MKDKLAFITSLFLTERRSVMYYFLITLPELEEVALNHLHRLFPDQMIEFLHGSLCFVCCVLMALGCPSIDCNICKPSDLIYGFTLYLVVDVRHGAGFPSLHLSHYPELLSD